MDKNTITGFVLIGVVVVAFSWMNRPSPEQVEMKQRMLDSIARVEQLKVETEIKREQYAVKNEDPMQGLDRIESDSLKDVYLKQNFGELSQTVMGNEEFFTLESDLLTLTFSNKGARMVSARLKNYQTHDSLPLYLFDKGDADYSFSLITASNRVVQTNQLYFQKAAQTDNSLTLRLSAGAESYIDFIYTVVPGDYMISFDIKSQGMGNVLSSSNNYLDFFWSERLRQQEKGQKFEERYAQLYYKFVADGVEYLSESSNDSKTLSNKVKWIGYKDQFFSTVLISKEGMSGVTVDSKMLTNTVGYLKDFKSVASVDYNPNENGTIGFNLYLGPNHYPTLRKYDSELSGEQQLNLDNLVPLGWGVFRWVNTYFIIPIFSFFGMFVSNYGIIILLLTLVVRIVISPLSYKSYMSSAKMRLLKPQMDDLNQKYPGKEKAMEKQKAMMELYGKAGVSPMSGCLPMLLQMPILFAMFSFFPSSIELRQESFLWAKDLSSYDAIVSWSMHIPIISEYFGNHISLFCLLSTITSVFYTKYNMDANPGGQEQMPGMKMMMYMMPLMLLVFFNQYASGLSYYYFLVSLLSIVEKFAFSKFMTDHKLLTEMKANAAKTHSKKKSGFWARVEQAQKQQEENLRKQKQKQSKGK